MKSTAARKLKQVPQGYLVMGVDPVCVRNAPEVVQYHLNILEQQGYIRRDREVSRSIGLVKKATDFSTVPS